MAGEPERVAESIHGPTQPNLKSVNSQVPSYVRFHNQTQRRVDIIWVNFDGVRKIYKTLAPKESYNINTYVTHPWIFRDADTNDKLVVSSEEVFFPQPYNLERVPGDRTFRRIVVPIKIPVYTLKERSTQVIRQILRTPEDAYVLEIPNTLKEDIANWSS